MSTKAGGGVRERLASGSSRGLGSAALIAAEAVRDEGVMRELMGALRDERAVVVARAANALKKVQQESAGALHEFAGELLHAAESCRSLEARWNLLAILGRLDLTRTQRAAAVDILLEATASGSAFQRVHAMQALFDLSAKDKLLQVRVREVIKRSLGDASAAVRARARKLQEF